MKDCAVSGSSVSDDRAPGPSSAPRLAQLLAYSRVQDLATIQEKLVEMEEYTRKLAAVQGELKDLLKQVLLAECCKMLQEK
ncbi:hypothetical protein JG688_00014065 [Phytophthora aleatoria]|uniref:Uncharacterized protein n=1 Tax=Phytophthora aleatoria TaxID=2496075 RepID=A0A8J5ICG4_9STRA|nr:hypothetical protein JG688_00014065 [Phytophthora aleatoria]